jgi:hypothetical protein
VSDAHEGSHHRPRCSTPIGSVAACTSCATRWRTPAERGLRRHRHLVCQDDAAAASGQRRRVAGQFRPKLPKLATFLDEAEIDVLAYIRSYVPAPAPDQTALDQTHRAPQRQDQAADRGGIFPNENAIVRLIGAILLEQNDERAVQRARYMTLETIAPLSDDPTVSLPAMPASCRRTRVTRRQLHHARGHDPLSCDHYSLPWRLAPLILNLDQVAVSGKNDHL